MPTRGKHIEVSFDWSPAIQITDAPDKYLIYATTFNNPKYNPEEVLHPSATLMLLPFVEYMVVVQGLNCAGYSKRTSIIGIYITPHTW